MTKFENLESLILMEKLIRQRRTGTPNELARRLCISRSALYDIIDELKMRGVEIKYCRTCGSFCYNGDAFLDIRFAITEINDREEMKNISGGYKVFSFRPLYWTE